MKLAGITVTTLLVSLAGSVMIMDSLLEKGICEDGLTCKANLKIVSAGGNVTLYAGYSISSSINGSAVGLSTKSRVRKSTPFKYRSIANALIEKKKTEFTANMCDQRTDMIALGIAESAERVAKNCTIVGTPECSIEQVVLECGVKTINPIKPLPWKSVLSTKTAPFDDIGSNFDILTELLRITNMTEKLFTEQNITVFLPTDEAIARSAHYIGMYRGEMNNEKKVYDTLAKTLRDGMVVEGVNITAYEVLRLFLGYHVTGKQLGMENFIGAPRSIDMINAVPVLSAGSKELIDLSPATPNSRIIGDALQIEGDVIVYAIDTALIPFANVFDSLPPLKCEPENKIQESPELTWPSPLITPSQSVTPSPIVCREKNASCTKSSQCCSNRSCKRLLSIFGSKRCL